MNILITGAFKWSSEQLDWLKDNGNNTIYYQEQESGQSDDIPIEIIDIVVCNWYFVYHDIREFSSLKLVQLLSAGMDRIDTEYCRLHNINLYNAKGVYSIPMAEYAIWGVMQLLKHSGFFYENQKKHLWEKERNIQELYCKNVLIVGTGSVGTETAKRFRAFTDNVQGIDLYPCNEPCYEKVWHMDMLCDALKWADVTVLCLPLTKETEGIINRHCFEICKEQMIFVNISRGGIVETDSLIEYLKNGKLMGAVLDVFEEEPLSKGSSLWDMENVIITPHNSFVGNNNSIRMWNVIRKNLVLYWENNNGK